MKRIVQFTRVRMLMLAMSALVIISGFTGTWLHHGFNLGIDFTGGVNKQFQIVPAAMTIAYTGTGAARLNVTGDTLSIIISGGQQPRQLDFSLRNSPTISDLVTAVGLVDGVTAQVDQGSAALPSTLIVPLSFPVTLSQTPTTVNRKLGPDEPIFAPISRVRAALSSFQNFSLQVIGSPRNQQFVLKIQTPQGGQADQDFLRQMDEQISQALEKEFGTATVVLQRTDFVGAVFSVDLIRGAVWSVVVALILILVYVTVRFKFVYAAAAVIALVHDVSVMIGVIGTFQLEVTSATIAAVLTIIGYSLNDTIVVFDRIRENYALMPDVARETVINTSITQSLSRTIITSLTTLLAVVAITIFGTGLIQDFSFNLIIGIVVGTYSSIYVAAPMVLGWQNSRDRRRRGREGVQTRPLPRQKAQIQAVEREEPAAAAPAAEEETDRAEPAKAEARQIGSAASAQEIRKEAERQRSKKRKKKR